MLWIKLNFHSGEPVYQQIVNNIKNNILNGKLPADSPVPSIRELAKDLKVNPNTVARAYRELESEGFIYSRPGVGSFINAQDTTHLKEKALQEVYEQFLEIVKTAKNYNIQKEDMFNIINNIVLEVYGGD